MNLLIIKNKISKVLKDFDGVFDTLGGDNLENHSKSLNHTVLLLRFLDYQQNAMLKIRKSIFKQGLLKAASLKYQRLAKNLTLTMNFIYASKW